MKTQLKLILILITLLIFPFTVKAEDTYLFYDADIRKESVANGIRYPLYIMHIDNQVSYSLDPTMSIIDIKAPKDFNYIPNNIPIRDLEYIRLVAYYGSFGTDINNSGYYQAAQELIWEKLCNCDVTWLYEEQPCDFEQYKNDINNKITNINLKPSFDNELITGQYGETIKIEDTNNVLSDYTIKNNSRNIVKYADNALYITIKDLNESTVELVKTISNGYEEVSYKPYKSAVFASFAIDKEVKASIKIKMEGTINSKIEIQNYDEKNNKINKEFSFKIKNLDTNEYVKYNNTEIFKTDNKGKFKSSFKLVYGNYEIEELDESIYYKIKQRTKFKIDENIGDSDYYTIKNNHERLYGLIKIYSKGQKFDKIIDNKTLYNTINLENTVFDIYAYENIYDYKNDIIYNKDQYISSVTTSVDGSALTKELPLGKYYIKIKSMNKEYIYDKNIHIVSLISETKQDKNYQAIMEIKSLHRFLNINITLVDINDLKFKLFNTKTKELIKEFKIENYNINDALSIPYGSYYIEMSKDNKLLDTFIIDFNSENESFDKVILYEQYIKNNIIFDIPKTYDTDKKLKTTRVLFQITGIMCLVNVIIKKKENNIKND